jgi:hypothetical protein
MLETQINDTSISDRMMALSGDSVNLLQVVLQFLMMPETLMVLSSPKVDAKEL